VLSYGGRTAIVGDPKHHNTVELIARIAGNERTWTFNRSQVLNHSDSDQFRVPMKFSSFASAPWATSSRHPVAVALRRAYRTPGSTGS
jgi:hypothetical protein